MISTNADVVSSQLSVWTDGEDWVVASSAEDATAICEHVFGSYEGEGGWKKLPTDSVVRVVIEDGPDLMLTCAQWIRRNGRGHLCSTDY